MARCKINLDHTALVHLHQDLENNYGIDFFFQLHKIFTDLFCEVSCVQLKALMQKFCCSAKHKQAIKLSISLYSQSFARNALVLAINLHPATSPL